MLMNSLPKAYPPNPNLGNIKAILLGCDPSNKHSQELPYVFAINSGLRIFERFLNDLRSNLSEIGLNFESVYSQNLCRNYFKEETYMNPDWKNAAKYWIPILKEELTMFDVNIPVLLTSEILYKVLIEKGVRKHKAADFYNCRVDIPVPISNNKLERPLIPFYRNRRKVDYHLSNPNWDCYKKRIIYVISEI